MNLLLQILSIRQQGFCCQCLGCVVLPNSIIADLQSRGPSDVVNGITL